jgi:glutathione S-transferase
VTDDRASVHKLYYSPQSCSLAPHIVLEEIGRPYETELVQSGDSSGTRSPEWRAINPKARIPALTGVPGSVGGAAGLLTEVPAILNYLASEYPEAGLLPSSAAEQARANEWMNWLSSSVHATSFSQIWRPHRFIADLQYHEALAEAGRNALLDQFAYIEALLSDGRTWAVADAYSIVDPYLLVFWRWGARIGLDMSPYPAWNALMAKVLARPAVQRVMAATGIA